MEAEVIIIPELRKKLIELIDILLEEEYFSFQENAHEYVDQLIDFIYTIPDLRHKRTRNKKHGSYYCKFSPNKNCLAAAMTR